MKKRKITIAAAVLILILLIYFLANAFAIVRYGKADEKRKSDVIIVLGAAAYESGVSPVYGERINHALWLYENGYADYIILTGGKADGAKVSDAYYAKEYALSKGVPEGAIFLEENSKITQENIKYSKEVMKENGFKTAIIVSDPLHMKRAMLMAKDYNLGAVSSPTPSTKYKSIKTKIPFLLREEFFYVGYKIWRVFKS